MENTHTSRTRGPAEAFDDMRAELSLLVRAIQGLTAEREKIPDYSETLGEMDGRLLRIAQNIALIEKHPAMKLTPEVMSEQIAAAASAARETDRVTIRKSQELHQQANVDFGRAIGRVRTKDEHRWHLLYCGLSVAITVSLLNLAYPGWAANLGPRSWLLPERVARRVLGEATLWDAGTRLMRAGDPEGWQAIVRVAEMQRANRGGINECELAAAKANKPVRCKIMVGGSRS